MAYRSRSSACSRFTHSSQRRWSPRAWWMDLMPRGRAMTVDEVEKFIRLYGDLADQRRTETGA